MAGRAPSIGRRLSCWLTAERARLAFACPSHALLSFACPFNTDALIVVCATGPAGPHMDTLLPVARIRHGRRVAHHPVHHEGDRQAQQVRPPCPADMCLHVLTWTAAAMLRACSPPNPFCSPYYARWKACLAFIVGCTHPCPMQMRPSVVCAAPLSHANKALSHV